MMALNTRESRVVSGCDSFNSLANQSEPAFWVIATVLRFLSKWLQAAKTGLWRQF
jgi:hypothetical protein